ncbi:MAG TPA: sulfatase-like hydrolase/transferase, partial [Verrucomicrobiae bacterium]
VDEDMADTLTRKAVAFIDQNKDHPFFLYFASHDPHVPRVPHPRFVGQSGCGVRGDVIVQFDWCVGEILNTLGRLRLDRQTLVILTSDNGPVVDDGYKDGAVQNLNGHKPAGPLRGGKYSNYEGGTRVPFIVSWPERVKPGVADALLSQIDLLASFAALTGQTLKPDDAPDSRDTLAALLGETRLGRPHLVEHAGALAMREGSWKYIEPGRGARKNSNTNTEMGNDPGGQLYDLATDLGESSNRIADEVATARRLRDALESAKRAPAAVRTPSVN